MAKVLVVGGAGYIGSTTVAWLLDKKNQVSVLDDLSTGHQELVLTEKFTRGKAGDRKLLNSLFSSEKFDCVMHFAAKSIVSESIKNPDLYFDNNVNQTRILLETMLDHGVDRFIFSSTCAVFGVPTGETLDESSAFSPISPYGESKLRVEEMLLDFAKSHGLHSIALRYFNAAGAEPQLRTGEWHENETHLIPNILSRARTGKPVPIFGTDYPTKDGTCVRDYIHVWDIAKAHGLALDYVLKTQKKTGLFEAFNLGTGCGFSVKEILSHCEEALGRKIDCEVHPRRHGDPPSLVSSGRLAKDTLSFEPEFSILQMIQTALKWEEKLEKLRTTKS